MRTLSALNRAFQVFCATLFGKYDMSVWDGETDYSRYKWRGKVYHVPPFRYDRERSE